MASSSERGLLTRSRSTVSKSSSSSLRIHKHYGSNTSIRDLETSMGNFETSLDQFTSSTRRYSDCGGLDNTRIGEYIENSGLTHSNEVDESTPLVACTSQSGRSSTKLRLPGKGLRSWRTILGHVKTAALFLASLACTVMFMAYPEMNSYVRQVSVTSLQPHSVNVSGVTASKSVIRLTLLGSFLLASPSATTHNVTVTVVNPASNHTWSLTQALSSYDSREKLPEITVTSLVNLEGQAYGESVQLEINTTDPTPVSLALRCTVLTPQVYHGVIYATVILVSVYVLIIFEIVHRTIAAILGSFASLAVLAYLNQKPSLSTVLSWLDEETLCLLFGMMLLVSVFCETGFFDWAALSTYKLVRGSTWPLITALCIFSAVISAFLDNVTTVLLLTPVTIRLCEALEIEPRHVLIAEVIFSNIGGTATAVGDPPNVLIVSNSHLIQATNGRLNFTTFTLHMSLGVIGVLFVAYGFLRLLYRKAELLKSDDSYQVSELKVEREIWRRSSRSMTVATREESMVRALLQQKIAQLDLFISTKSKQDSRSTKRDFHKVVAEMKEKYYIRDTALLFKSSLVLAAVVVMFFVQPLVPGMDASSGWIAVIGACWLLILSDHPDLEAVLHRIDWATLIFFSALFVLMEAVQELGLIDWIAQQVIIIIQGIDESVRLAVAIITVIWISAIASAFIDNIPFTTAMIPVIVKIAEDKDISIDMDPLIWALAFGSCLGGNGTLLGASANVVCAGIAETHGHGFNFWQFFKVGFPTMLCTVTIAMIYLLVCHVAFSWPL